MAASHDSETPAVGKQVITACAFIWAEFDGVKKVFLAKRADTKKFLPGVYELLGGHIDFGEDLVAGLKREIKEELGMSVSVGDVFFAHDYTNAVKGSHSVEVIYFAKFADSLANIKLNPEDHSTSEWFSEEDVRRRVEEIRPKVAPQHSFSDDPELLAIFKGFELLNGKAHNFG